MIEPSKLIMFISAVFMFLIIPGPAVLYIVTQSVTQGRLAGFISALGMAVGGVGHVIAAALGISALLMSSVLAFSVVKYLGAAYLLYLGVYKLYTQEESQEFQFAGNRKLSRIFYQAILVNLLNPKTALFFLAFLPQFISASNGSVSKQILFLGAIIIIMGLINDSLYALLAGTMGGWVRSSSQVKRIKRYFSGGVYIALGVAAAISSSGRK